jgi:hypothetical protein
MAIAHGCFPAGIGVPARRLTVLIGVTEFEP